MGLGKFLDDLLTRVATFACGMSEPAAADSVLNIEDEVVTWARRDSHRHGIQGEGMTGFPGNYVIGTRSIPAHTERTDHLPLLIVESKPSPETDHPSDRFSHQWVVRLTELLRISANSGPRIGTTHDAVKRTT